MLAGTVQACQGRLVEQLWIVLLEAAGATSGPPLGPDKFRELMATMAGDQIVGLHDPFRYAIQLRMVSSSPAEALFAATARWADAVSILGLDTWTLQRGEVLTPEEFERDWVLAEQHNGLPSPPGGREGDGLLHSVFYDSLTGFPTLALFRDRAQGIVSSGALSGRQLAMVVVDIDGFGAINRDLGYIYGDQVLVDLATRLSQEADWTWTVARLAGDEFLFLVDDNAGSAEAVATQLLAAVRPPMVLKGRPITLTASVGLVPVNVISDLDECLRQAGTAMCAAKEAGGDCLRWYEPGMIADVARLDLLAHCVPDRLAYVVLLERAALAANECASLEEASAIVLRQVIAQTGWRAGHLWLVDDNRTRLVSSGVSHLSVPGRLEHFRRQTEHRTFAAGQGLPGRVLRTGSAAWADPVSATDAWTAATFDETSLMSTVAFPVLAGTEVVAVLEFFNTVSLLPDESLLDVMAAVGAQLGRIFERTRADAALARSEERYRMMADSLPAFIWATGPDSSTTFVNRGWLDFTGRSVEEELGRGWTESVHEEDVTFCLETYLKAFDRREVFEMEYRARRVDGEYRWLLVHGSPVFEDGEFSGYVGSAADITDRHRADDERRDEEVRFRALVGNADSMIIVLAADGTMIDEFVPASNLGYQPGQELGRLGSDYVHPDDRACAAAVFADAVASPGPGRPFECRVRHANGSWRWLRATANNMLDDPVIRGIVYTAVDITEQKTLSEMLHATEQKLRKAEHQLRLQQGHTHIDKQARKDLTEDRPQLFTRWWSSDRT